MMTVADRRYVLAARSGLAGLDNDRSRATGMLSAACQGSADFRIEEAEQDYPKPYALVRSWGPRWLVAHSRDPPRGQMTATTVPS